MEADGEGGDLGDGVLGAGLGGRVAPAVPPPTGGPPAAAKARAEEAVSEIAALSVRLHATLVKSGLRTS